MKIKSIRVNVIVPHELKLALLHACLELRTSLIAEVTLTLLSEYKPAGYKEIGLAVRERSTRRNKRPQTKPGAYRYIISLELPVELRNVIVEQARENSRSVGGEIRATLQRRYKKWIATSKP